MCENQETVNLNENESEEAVCSCEQAEAQESEADALQSLREIICSLDKKFDEKISTDEWKNKKYDEMHSLMLKYQDDSFSKTVNPLLKSLIQLSDGILRDIKFLKNNEGSEEFIETLIGIDEQIQSVLFDYDIEFDDYGKDDEVNTKHNRIVKTVSTDDISLNNKVAETLSRCYLKGESVFRMGRVNVYKAKNTEENKEDE